MNLNQVTVPCSDMETSVAFYSTLGLRLIVLSEGTYARFECPTGDSTFSLHQVETRPSGDGIWIYFEVDDLETTVDRLKHAGIQFELDITEQSWLWAEAHLLDPDRNKIIVYHAGSNRKNPPWRLL